MAIQEFPFHTEEKLVADCCRLLDPREEDLLKFARDPLVTYQQLNHLSLAYAENVLGESHPLITMIKASLDNSKTFIPPYLRMIEDTLRRWPIRNEHGQPLDPQEALRSLLKYSAATMGRYLPVLDVLTSATQGGDFVSSDNFAPLDYRINGKTKSIKFHRSLGILKTKEELFGDKPVFGFRQEDLPFDFIILHPDPEAFVREMAGRNVFKFFSGLNNGRYYLPPHIRQGLRHLDYVMFHQPGANGIWDIFSPDNGGLSRGFCFPFDSEQWPNGCQYTVFAYLAVAHEVQHIMDEVQYPWGSIGEFVVTELRAFRVQEDISVNLNWQDADFYRDLVNQYIPANLEIMLGHGWTRFGLNHDDTINLEHTKQLLTEVARHENGAFLLAQTKAFLEGYLH